MPKEARYRRYRSAADLKKNLIDTAGKDSCHRAIVAFGRLVGYCGWNDHMEVFIFLGHPVWRGRGVGTKAIKLLLQEFKARGRFALSAKTDRPDFWFKLGFKEVHNDWRLTQADKDKGRIMLLWDRRQHNGAS